jgi:hypothetical protein
VIRAIARCAVISATLTTPMSSQSADRGPGIRTSMVETYVAKHQFLVFPFVAHTRDRNFEYQPAQFGYGLEEDFRGRFWSTEAQLFVAYGVNDWLALELETSDTQAHFEKSPSDPSATPARINESGIADLSGQLHLRLARERAGRPEIVASVEVLPPSHGNRVLIGDAEWNVKGVVGASRSYRWGTLTFRSTIEYNRGDTHWDLGETSLEYLRQVSRVWRLFFAIEGGEGGAPDDWALVSAAGWRLGDQIYLKFANAIGLFSKSTDWEPQVGVMVAIP